MHKLPNAIHNRLPEREAVAGDRLIAKARQHHIGQPHQSLGDTLNLATSVSKELAADTINYLNKQFGQNVELSKQALTCRTLNDMFDLATRITKANLDGFFSQSVKISEMVFQCATDVSEPINDRISESASRLSKVMAS
jgi:hypothetical protein